MCKVKGCARPQFLGGLCGLHALQVAVAPAPGRAGPPLSLDGAVAQRRRGARREKAPRISG